MPTLASPTRTPARRAWFAISFLRTLRTTLAFCLTVSAGSLLSFQGSLAADTVIGPQGQVGVVPEKVGPQGAVGPQGLLGPQDVGPVDMGYHPEDVGYHPADVGYHPADTGHHAADTGAHPVDSAHLAADIAASSAASLIGNNTSNQNTYVTGNTNTGNNTVLNNTQVGQVQSGNVNGAVTVVNVGNSVLGANSTIGSQSLASTGNTVTLNPASNTYLLQGTNSNTGAGSTNSNAAAIADSVRVQWNNLANTLTQTVLGANTGGNVVAGNTSVGYLETGNINLAVTVVNLLNVYAPETNVHVNVWSLALANPNAQVNVNMSNQGTGSGSTNSNTAALTNQNNIQVQQLASANNQLHVNATTGGNTLSGNTTIGGVTTGSTLVEGNVVTVTNTPPPMVFLVNNFGSWAGTLNLPPNSYVILGSNSGTGAGSLNTNATILGSVNELLLTQNANVTNNVVVNANTGGNSVLNNTQVGGIETGNIHIMANIVNFLNVWGNLPEFHLGIINLFTEPEGYVPEPPENEVVVEEEETPITEIEVTVPIGGGGTYGVVPSESGSGSGSKGTGGIGGIGGGTQLALLGDNDFDVIPVAAAAGPQNRVLGDALPDTGRTGMPWVGITLGVIGSAWLLVELVGAVAARRREV